MGKDGIVIVGKRGLWIYRAMISAVAFLLVMSIALFSKGVVSIVMGAVSCIIAIGAIAETIKAIMPYRIHMSDKGITLVTPFRSRFWVWRVYKGVIRVAAPLGDKPLLIKVDRGSKKAEYVLIGNWPGRIEDDIQKFALQIGQELPRDASYSRN